MVNIGGKATNQGRFKTGGNSAARPADTECDTAQNPQHNRSNRRAKTSRPFRTVAVVLLLIVCGGIAAVPAVWLGWPLIAGTLQAGKGAECPMCAIDGYINDGPLDSFGDDLVFHRYLCDQSRDQLAKQAADFAGAYRNAAQRLGLSPRVDVTTATPQVDVERAAVTVPMVHSLERFGGATESRSQHDWRFELVNDNGWRVCKVEHPDVCHDLIRCTTAADPTPSPTPTAKVWDLRVPYRCLPDRPYRDLEKGCQSPPPDWTQPGPYYCAPDQPWGIPATKHDECAERGWR